MSDTLSALVSRPRRIGGSPALFVGIVADAPRTPGGRIGLAGIERVEIARGDTGRKIERKTVEGVATLVVTLSDPRMSSKHARLSKLGTTWVVEDLGSKNGTWIGSQRVTRKPLIDGEAMIVGHTALVFRDEGGEDADLAGAPPEVLPGLATLSPGLAARYRELAAAARGTGPIQIVGPAGTARDLVARAVHEASGRGGNFVPINCGAMPGPALEAELPDALRDAEDGTLLLDDITELSAATQAALLAALAGAPAVRVVAGSPRSLDVEVAANRFAAELRARLAGHAIELPPLRDRLEDLGLIVDTILGKLAADRAITFSVDALGSLYAHDWPLNLHELERTLAAALAVAGTRIEISHLPASVGDTESIDDEMPLAPFGNLAMVSAAPAPAAAPAPPLSDADRALRDKLVETIGRHGGNLAAVARELGKDRTQIRRWMKRFGLTRETV